MGCFPQKASGLGRKPMSNAEVAPVRSRRGVAKLLLIDRVFLPNLALRGGFSVTRPASGGLARTQGETTKLLPAFRTP